MLKSKTYFDLYSYFIRADWQVEKRSQIERTNSMPDITSCIASKELSHSSSQNQILRGLLRVLWLIPTLSAANWLLSQTYSRLATSP